MRIAKRIKRDTLVLVISIIVLTLATMRVAYSAVFSVKSALTVQEIEAGTLDVVIDSTASQSINIEELLPTGGSGLPSAADSVISGNYATLVIKNSGTLDSDFSVSVTYDDLPANSGYTTADLISFDYLLVGIYDVTNDTWIRYGSSYYTQIGSVITPSETNVYPILRSSIAAPVTLGNTTSKQYRVYIWLKDDTPDTEIGKLAYLKLIVKSVVAGQS